MKSVCIAESALVVGAIILSQQAIASELSGSVTLASEYIDRGRALSDHNPALQASINFEHDIGLYVGASASTIDLRNRFGSRHTELDLYAGFYHERSPLLAYGIAVVRYTYPGQTGFYDYDYTEGRAHLTFLDRVTVEYAFTNDIYGFASDASHWALRFQQRVDDAWLLSAGIGENDLTKIGVAKYAHWDAGVTARFAWLGVDLRWYDNESIVGAFQVPSAGSRVVLALTAAF